MDPARFLGDFEGGVEGVVCNEGVVALVRGIGTSTCGDTYRDTVYNDFGPFYIGPGNVIVGDGGAVGISKVRHKIGDMSATVLSWA